MQEKKCKTCLQVKALGEFHKAKGCKDGRRGQCKSCFHAAAALRNSKKREEVRAYKKEWYHQNKNKIRQYNDARDPVKKKESQKKWRQENPEKLCAATSRYRAAKLRRSPEWLTEEHHWMIQEVYEIAKLRTDATGVPHEVDHVVPLQGDVVSGLHVPWNLQVIPARENRSKGNVWTV